MIASAFEERPVALMVPARLAAAPLTRPLGEAKRAARTTIRIARTEYRLMIGLLREERLGYGQLALGVRVTERTLASAAIGSRRWPPQKSTIAGLPASIVTGLNPASTFGCHKPTTYWPGGTLSIW